MNNNLISLTFPVTYVNTGNKVVVIKALRMLSGLGLKEAKDMSEINGTVQLDLSQRHAMCATQADIDVELGKLRNNGVQVGDTVLEMLDELRAMGIAALKIGEDDFANEILQLVLAEKLRRSGRSFQ